MGEPHVQASVQEGACGQKHLAGGKAKPLGRAHARNPGVVRSHGRDLVLPEAQARRVVERLLEDALVSLAVYLSAGGAHGRALAHVQHAELDARGIGPEAHHAPQGVDFAHHMALGQAADGRVAGKITQAVQIAGDEQHVVPQTGQGHSGLAAGMAAARHNAVKKRIRHGRRS